MKRDQIRRHYEPRVDAELESYDILDWASREAQESRFAVLARLLPHSESHRRHGVELLRHASGKALGTIAPPPPPLRLLDVGCGLADLQPYLQRRRIAVDYTGIDITQAILDEARRRHPGVTLIAADPFERAPFTARSFDIVFASGVFNLNLGNNAAFLAHALPKLLELADEYLVVNFLHTRAAHHYPHCHYYEPEELLTLLRPMARRIECVDDYLENDFTLVVGR